MKKGVLIIIVIFFGISRQTFSQLKLYKEHNVEIMGSLELFLIRNNFEYALISYSTYPWLTAPRVFSCVVKQENSWYLLQMSERSVVYPGSGPLRPRPSIKQKQLTSDQADSVLAILKPGEGMRYTQGELNALPKSCESICGGRKSTFGGLCDAGTYYLTEQKADKVVSLSFYGADIYLRKCLPLNPEFEILKGMVNTFQKLDSIAASMTIKVSN